jgi:hypothetical protein
MKTLSLITLSLLLWIGSTTQIHAQKLLNLLTERYGRITVDTAYITRPQTKWTVKGRINVSGAELETEGTDMGRGFKTHVASDYKSTVSLGVNYMGVAVSLALNPAKLLGKYKDYELNLRSYNNRWGVDLAYQDSRNFKGWYQDEGEARIDLPEDVLSMKSLNVNFYYAFNHRRFSYPAAFTQSYIQRRSAGSFLLGVSGQGQDTETKGDFQSKLRVTNIGIGAGYGYNWVPGRHWLLHISALPTFTVYSNTSLKVDDERIPLHYHFPEVIITARGAIVRQFGNMFAGINMVFNYTNIGNIDQLAIMNTKWRNQLFVGYRF